MQKKTRKLIITPEDAPVLEKKRIKPKYLGIINNKARVSKHYYIDREAAIAAVEGREKLEARLGSVLSETKYIEILLKIAQKNFSTLVKLIVH